MVVLIDSELVVLDCQAAISRYRPVALTSEFLSLSALSAGYLMFIYAVA